MKSSAPRGRSAREKPIRASLPDGTIRMIAAEGEPEAPLAEEEEPRPAPPRLASLDAFRGLTVLGMLLANNIALDTAAPRGLTHAAWNQGLNFADVLFPWFLFIVGVAVPFSVASFRRRGLPVWRYDLRVAIRALSLVLIGCVIDSSLVRRPVFDLSVLQLIGLAYLAGAPLYELPWHRRMVVAGVLLAGHWALLRYLPVPGLGVGVIAEGRNAVVHINQVYLHPYHLEGLVSVMPAAAMVLIGTAVGDLLRGPRLWRRDLLLFPALGLGLMAVGWLWSLYLPFSKVLWTSPYILYTAGLGVLVLAGFYFVMDGLRVRFWAFPLLPLGVNPLTAYVAPILVKLHILQEWTWTFPNGARLSVQDALTQLCFREYGRVTGGWVYTAGYVLFWWLVLLVMYRRKVYWRV